MPSFASQKSKLQNLGNEFHVENKVPNPKTKIQNSKQETQVSGQPGGHSGGSGCVALSDRGIVGASPKFARQFPEKNKMKQFTHVTWWPSGQLIETCRPSMLDYVGIWLGYVLPIYVHHFFTVLTLLLLDLFGFIDWLLENWKWQLWRHQKSSTHLKTHLKHKNIKGPHVVQHTNLSL